MSLLVWVAGVHRRRRKGGGGVIDWRRRWGGCWSVRREAVMEGVGWPALGLVRTLPVGGRAGTCRGFRAGVRGLPP